MNVLWLKYAVEVANTGSISKAAENLYMGQPNLSRAIKELEESLGITIFERSSKGIRITQQGEEFLGYAHKILRQIDEIEKMYTQSGDKSKRKFSVCVPRASYICEAFTRFVQDTGRDCALEFFYKETSTNNIINYLVRGDCKLGIIRYATDYDRYFLQMFEEKGLHHEEIARFRYLLLMSKHHPLAQKDEILFDDLKPYVEIAHPDPFVPSLPLATVKKEELPNNIDKRIFVSERASQFELLCSSPDTFMWVSPVPQELLDRYSLVQRECVQNTKLYSDMLVYKNDYALSEQDLAFVSYLSKASVGVIE